MGLSGILINPSRPDLRRKEKIKTFIKPFEAPKKSVKIKI